MSPAPIFHLFVRRFNRTKDLTRARILAISLTAWKMLVLLLRKFLSFLYLFAVKLDQIVRKLILS